MKISDNQQKIIDYIGHLIVIAPPGSGKTFTLTKKIEKVQKESKKKIIALTFSNKAAEELKERIIDKQNVITGTIHGFCQEIVLSRGFQIGLPASINIISEEDDKLFIIHQVINESSVIKEQINDFSDEYMKKILNYIKEQKEKLIPPDEILNSDNKFARLYYEIYSGYNNKMLSQKLVDFDDLLFYAYQILSLNETKALYKRLYGHLYVDEAQDLNSTQYSIIKLLSSIIDDVMLIGDPSQAIYKFMGSDKIFMEEKFKIDFNAMEMRLEENYRSAKKIVEMINILNDSNTSLASYPIDGQVEYREYDTESDEANSIVEKISELNKNDGIDYRDIAILGRNIYVFGHIKTGLEKNKIPFNMGPIGKIEMESNEGKILLEYLKLLGNPDNEIIKNGLKEKFELDNADMKEIEKHLEANYNEISEFGKKVFQVPLKFDSEIDKLMNYYTKKNDAMDEAKYFVVNDLGSIKENWRNYLTRIPSEKRAISSFVNDLQMGKTQKYSFEGVSLLTVHKAKGLEYDTTFVVGMNEGVLPDYRAIKQKDLSEEDNNVYVALSRAKRRCFISSVKTKLMPWGNNVTQKKSRYIEKISRVF